MKKVLLSSVSMAMLSLSSLAAVHTVSNNPNSPGQYTVVQDAVNAAAPNDTIYVHGSQTSYGSVTLSKPLVLIGAGALPDKRFAFSTVMDYITIGWNAANTQNASGSKVYGFQLYGISIQANGASTAGISNITIQRNRVGGISFSGLNSGLHQNVFISNNIIGSVVISNRSVNIYVKNNIITSNLSGGNETLSGWVIANNVIYGRYGGCRNASIYNNIFYSASSNVANGSEYCSVSNNIIVGPLTYTESMIVFGTNTGGNNILNQDPIFVNADTNPGDYSYTNPANGPFVNYNLSAGSPAIGTGVGGTDMGVYGGDSPFFEGTPANSRYRYFPMPAIPAMLDMDIINSAVEQNGTLNVNFKARKQD